MESDWLTAASFERTHDVVSAINTLSIHAKLMLAGIANPAPKEDINAARTCLITFLDNLQGVLQQAEQRHDGTIIGADPRFSELAIRYLAQKQSGSRRATIFNMPLSQCIALVNADQPEQPDKLIEYLGELRALLEQHSHADITGIFGDI